MGLVEVVVVDDDDDVLTWCQRVGYDTIYIDQEGVLLCLSSYRLISYRLIILSLIVSSLIVLSYYLLSCCRLIVYSPASGSSQLAGTR